MHWLIPYNQFYKVMHKQNALLTNKKLLSHQYWLKSTKKITKICVDLYFGLHFFIHEVVVKYQSYCVLLKTDLLSLVLSCLTN